VQCPRNCQSDLLQSPTSLRGCQLQCALCHVAIEGLHVAVPAFYFFGSSVCYTEGLCLGLWSIPKCLLWRCALAPVAMRLGPDGPGWGCPEKAVGPEKAIGARWIAQRRLTAITLFSRVLTYQTNCALPARLLYTCALPAHLLPIHSIVPPINTHSRQTGRGGREQITCW
jgi:hypothetical protein